MSEPTRTEAWTVYESPLGPLTLRAGRGGIHGLDFPGRSPRLEEAAKRPPPANRRSRPGPSARPRCSR